MEVGLQNDQNINILEQFSLLLGIFWIYLIFKFISSVVEDYLAPAIEFISEDLNLPESLAAVTLLALANGAGDVVTAQVACQHSGGLAYNIGAIYGAGLFVCSIIVALTIYLSPKDIQLDRNVIWRDVGFYILSTLVIIGFGLYGELSIISAITLLSMYVLMVIVVYIQEKGDKKTKEDGEEEDDKQEPEHDKDEEKRKEQIRAQNMANKDLIYFKTEKTDEEQKAFPKKWRSLFEKSISSFIFSDTLSRLNTANAAARMKILAQKFRSTVLLMMKLNQKKEDDEVPWNEMPITDKILFIIDQPFVYMRKFTLTPAEADKYEKKWAMIVPVPGLIMVFVILCYFPPWWIYPIIIPFGMAASLGIYMTSPEHSPPRQITYATFGAIVWTYFVSGILIDFLQFFGMVSKLNKTYLGLTVIAVGNALPDGVTTIALSKQGYAIMGLTGAYAGQLFGLLIGFGAALVTITLQKGPQEFEIFNPDKLSEHILDIAVIGISLINLLITFMFGIRNQYKFTQKLAKLLGTLYIMFVLFSTTIAISIALK